MTEDSSDRAMAPEDLPRLFVRFAEAGEFDSLASLYEPDAVAALPDGSVVRGNTQIAKAFGQRLSGQPFDASRSTPQPVLRTGDFALTSTHLPDGRVTAEVAHRQADGSWLWVIDQPDA